MGEALSLIGQWAKAKAIVGSMVQKFEVASQQAIAQEAHFIRKEVVTGIREGAPGGKAFEPLSPLTLMIRKAMGFHGTKPLMNRGDLRNNIVVKRVGDGYFVGVLRTARSKTGKELMNVAELMEKGGGPYVIPITPKSRRYFHAMLRRAGIELAPKAKESSGGGRAFVIVKIVARPFLSPVFEKYGANASEVQARFSSRLAAIFR